MQERALGGMQKFAKFTWATFSISYLANTDYTAYACLLPHLCGFAA